MSVEHHHARQHRLSSEQNAEYFVNTQGGPPRTFMLRKFAPGMSYAHAADTMKNEFHRDSRQLQVHSTLGCVKLGTLLSMHSVTFLYTGLTSIVEKIKQLTPYRPAGFPSEENKNCFPRGAVINYLSLCTSGA